MTPASFASALEPPDRRARREARGELQVVGRARARGRRRAGARGRARPAAWPRLSVSVAPVAKSTAASPATDRAREAVALRSALDAQRRRALVADLEDVQEHVVARRPRRARPRSASPRAPPRGGSRATAAVMSLAPEGQPHLLEIGIGGQRAALGRIERPVLARAPGPAALVARRPELEARSAADHHLALDAAGAGARAAGPAVLERDERARRRTSVPPWPMLAPAARLRPSARSTPCSSQTLRYDGVRAAHAVEHEQHVGSRQPEQLAHEALELARLVGARAVAARVVVAARAPDSKASMRPRSQRSRVRRQSSRLRTEFQKRDESMRWPPSLAAGHWFSPQKKRLARLVHEHRVVGDGAPVVVQVVRALGVGVVGARVDGQVALVVDREVVRVEVVVLGEVRARRRTAIQVESGPQPSRSTRWPTPREEPLARQLGLGGRARDRAARPLSSRHRNSSTGMLHFAGSQPLSLQEPGRVGVLEAMHRVAEDHVVERRRGAGTRCRRRAPSSRRAGPCRDRSGPCCGRRRSGGPGRRRVVVRRSSAMQGQRRPGDAHVVHRLVVRRRRGSRARSSRGCCRGPGRACSRSGAARLLHRRVPFDRGQGEARRGRARAAVWLWYEAWAGSAQRLEGEHLLPRRATQLARHPVLERGVEAGEAVEPVEGQAPRRM